MNNNNLNKISLTIALELLICIFSLFILTSFGFIFGLNVNGSYMLISFILMVCLPIKYNNLSIKENIISLLITSIVIISSIYISKNILDTSYDGPWYHQTATIFISKGWNPIYTTAEDFFNAHWTAHISGLIWVDSYPKFFEIIAANIFRLTDNIETGKALNFIFAAILFFYAFYIFGQNVLQSRPIARAIISFLLICNPIVISQMNTYYVDGTTYIFFMLMILAIIDIETNNPKAFWILIISAISLANIKLIGIVYTLCILLFYSIYLLINKKKLNPLSKSTVIVLIFVFLTGINPYITNLCQGKNIIHPIAGAEKIDILTHNTPQQFMNKPMYYKLFMSTFAKTSNHPYSYPPTIKLKYPLTIDESEYNYLWLWDTRINGFGVYWSAILLASIILAFFIRFRNKEEKQLFFLSITTILATVLLNQENWWARYVPQFYAFPIFVCTWFLAQALSKKRIIISIIFIALILANSGQTYTIVQRIGRERSYYRTIQLRNIYMEMRHNPNFIKRLQQKNANEDFTAPTLLFLDKYGSK